jgi:hypothetical protein
MVGGTVAERELDAFNLSSTIASSPGMSIDLLPADVDGLQTDRLIRIGERVPRRPV